MSKSAPWPIRLSIGLAISILWSVPASAAVSAAEFASYLARNPQPQTFEAAIAPVVEMLATSRAYRNIPRVRSELAERWHISADAAAAVVELVILAEIADSTPAKQAFAHRVRGVMERVVETAPESPEAWRVVLWYLDKSETCDDPSLRSRYFRKSWAPNDYLHRDDYSCVEWLFFLPAFAPDTALLDARVVEQSDYGGIEDVAGGLAAARALLDSLRRANVPVQAPERLYAQRRLWTLLAQYGLTDEVLGEAKDLGPEDLAVVLNGQVHGAVMVDGHELENEPYVQRVARDLQTEWILALLEHDRRAEARDWLVRWDSQETSSAAPTHAPDPNDQVIKTTREILQRIANDSTEDIFDLLMGGGGGDPPHPIFGGLNSPSGRRVLVDYLTKLDYPDIAAYLRTEACSSSHGDESSHSWVAFPGDFHSAQQSFAARIEAARRTHPECSESEPVPASAPIGQRNEIPLPIALRSKHAAADAPVIPAYARRALEAFKVVRYSASGDLTAAISLSQLVDPTGEVSGGGYWLHLSSDHGHTWRPPLYLGFEQYVPYVVLARSKLPLIRGRMLQVEVEVREIDLSRIMFPPIAVPTRRYARDLYIELSLDDVERDSDGDGLTDLLEEKLGTNPFDPDTDHDGLRDDIDPLPQASRTGPPVADSDVVRMTLEAVFGYDKAAIHTGGPIAPTDSLPSLLGSLTMSTAGHKAHSAPSVLFIEGDPAFFQGLTLPGRVIVMTPEQVRVIRAKYGLFYPIQLYIMFNHARTKAVVIWSASWTGGTLRFEKSDGRWLPPAQDGWIT